jgi:hypothetical protein
MELVEIIVIIGSIIIPLVGFILALRPFIKDTIKVELGDIRERLARLEESSRLANEYLPKLIPLLPKSLQSQNPEDRKTELLKKLENRTLTYNEAIELKNILEREAEEARERGDTMAVFAIMLFLLMLALAIAALGKK